MRPVIVGYGKYKHYRLQEIPQEFLSELALTYPLDVDAHEDSDRDTLYMTVAIHEELHRRTHGGLQSGAKPSIKDLAFEIITKGFHMLSRVHHPDQGGDVETQQALTAAASFLREQSENLMDNYPENAVVISDPASHAPYSPTTITDEDIPF